MKIERPRRVKHSYTQSLAAPPGAVFPLLCPVREADWIPEWDPVLVLTESGVAEPDCVFVTPGGEDGSPDAVWILTHHDPNARHLTFYKVTPGVTVGKIEIALAADGADRTRATVSYEHTALGPKGEEFLEGFTEEWYRDFMEEWERLLNHYLETGKRIERS